MCDIFTLISSNSTVIVARFKRIWFYQGTGKKDETYNIIDLENRYSPGDKGPFFVI